MWAHCDFSCTTNPGFLDKNKKSEIQSTQKNNCEIIVITWRKQQMFHLLLELSEGELIFQACRVHANQKHFSLCSSIIVFLKMFFVLA